MLEILWFLSWSVLKLVTGKSKEISISLGLIGVFAAIVLSLQQHISSFNFFGTGRKYRNLALLRRTLVHFLFI
jgi:hypothetical protein